MGQVIHPLSVGVAFQDNEPRLLLRMNDEWRTLPYANALLMVNQMLSVIEAMKPATAREGAPLLVTCAEYGPFVEPA